jgi:hypothetical protein
MKNRLFLVLASVFLLGAMIFSTTFFQVVDTEGPRQRLNLEDIRGMAAEKDGELYTLSFAQQNLAATLLNGMLVAEEKVEGEPLPTLHIYRFDRPPLQLKVRKDQRGYVYVSFDGTLLVDGGQGEFEQVLKKAI